MDTCVHVYACTHAQGECCISTSLHRPTRVVLLGPRVGETAGGGHSAHRVPTMCQDRQTRGSQALRAPGLADIHRPSAVTLQSRHSVPMNSGPAGTWLRFVVYKEISCTELWSGEKFSASEILPVALKSHGAKVFFFA